MGLSGGDRSPRESLKNQDTQALRAPPSLWILIQQVWGIAGNLCDSVVQADVPPGSPSDTQETEARKTTGCAWAPSRMKAQ